MENPLAELLSILSLINLNFKWIGLGVDPDKCPRRLNACVIVVGSACYMLFLVHCISETTVLDTASGMMFHIPWMLQYNLKTVNMYLQFNLARDVLRWAKRTATNVHPEPAIEAILKATLSKGLRMAKKICG